MIRATDKLQRFPVEPRGLIPSLCPSTPPPLLQSDPLLHTHTRTPSRGQTGGHVPSQGLLGPYPPLPHTVPIPRHPVREVSSCHGRLPKSYISPGGGRSLLGAAPPGFPLKNPHMTFLPKSHHQPHGSFVKKEASLCTFQRKRGNKLIAEEKSNDENPPETSVGGNPGSSIKQAEPPGKKQRNLRAAGVEYKSAEQNSATSSPMKEQEAYEEEEYPTAETDKEVEQSRTAEVGVGTSLKVTIQRSGESRAFSTGLEEAAAASGPTMDRDMNPSAYKHHCYICNVTCPDQLDFQTHMISLGHREKMMEIQNLSNTCLAKLLPRMHQSLRGKQRCLQRWCAVCQCHYTADLIEHRRTKKHKMAKISSRPFCTVCERHFRTPRKFVEHMKSPEHKQQVEELKEGGRPEVMEELITLDAIGCFEDEDEFEEEVSEDEEAPVSEQISDDGEFDPDTQYGTSFVVPVAGFLCKLCHRFYHFESRARETHCRSLTHFQNLQKYKSMLNRLQEDEENPDTRAGKVRNDKNSIVCTEDRREEEEEDKQFIPHPHSGHIKKQTPKLQTIPSILIKSLTAENTQCQNSVTPEWNHGFGF